ncbi:MAG: hypothetical protein RL701_372 [Pseudomonadota bacterium]
MSARVRSRARSALRMTMLAASTLLRESVRFDAGPRPRSNSLRFPHLNSGTMRIAAPRGARSRPAAPCRVGASGSAPLPGEPKPRRPNLGLPSDNQAAGDSTPRGSGQAGKRARKLDLSAVIDRLNKARFGLDPPRSRPTHIRRASPAPARTFHRLCCRRPAASQSRPRNRDSRTARTRMQQTPRIPLASVVSPSDAHTLQTFACR